MINCAENLKTLASITHIQVAIIEVIQVSSSDIFLFR